MKLIINFLIVLSTMSCQQEKTETYSTNDFTISYPSNLLLDKSGQEGTIFILTTEQQGDDDVFIENINLAIRDVGQLQFEEFIAQAKKDVGTVATITEDKRLQVNGDDCLSLTFELTQNNVDLTFVQHFYVKNQKAYVLTFSSERKEFDNQYDSMNEVLMSFKIK